MGEIIFLILLLAGTVYFYFLTGSFRISKLDTSGGAAMFPRIVLVFIGIMLAIRIIQILVLKEKKEFVFRDLFRGSRLLFIVSMTAYVLLAKPLGYLVTTSLFLIVVCNGLYRISTDSFGTVKHIVIRNVLLLLFVVAMNYAFGHLLTVRLPEGIIGF